MWNEDDIDRYNEEQIKDYKDKLKLLRKLENNCDIKEPIINNGYPNICPNEFDCLRRETMHETVYTVDELIDVLNRFNKNTRIMTGTDFFNGVDVSLIEKGTYISDSYDLEADTISIW